MEVEFEGGGQGCSLLYESVVEEIALEGLDGITLQALFLRLFHRPSPPVCKDEGERIFISIWESVKRDGRLRLYLLPDARNPLQIWDRSKHLDERDNPIEPSDSPEEIYNYKWAQVKGGGAKERLKKEIRKGKGMAISLEERKLATMVDGCSEGEVTIHGIRFKQKVKDTATATAATAKEDEVNMDEEEQEPPIVDVRGSCSQFEGRKDITVAIRKCNLSYGTAATMLHNRLVIVASQFLRETLLFRSANQLELTELQYGMVERVGRARHNGEQARGKISLTSMGIDAKNLFYMRKYLLSEGIISKQPLVMKFGANKQPTLISVFHLPHFFTRQDSVEDVKIRKIFAYLFNSVGHTVEYKTLLQVFGKYLMRVLALSYKDSVKFEDVPLVSVYPDAMDTEPEDTEELTHRRTLRVVSLRDPTMSLKDVIEKQLSKQVVEEGDEGSEGQSLQVDGEDPTFDWTFCYVPERELAYESETSQILKLIMSRGSAGVLQQDLVDIMGMTNLDARAAMRFAVKCKFAKQHMEEHGRTKVTRYTYFKFQPAPPIPSKKGKKIKEKEKELDDELEKTFEKSSTSSKKKKAKTVPLIKPLPLEEPEMVIILPKKKLKPKKRPPPGLPPKKKRSEKTDDSLVFPVPIPPAEFRKKCALKRKATADLPLPIVKTKKKREVLFDFVDQEAISNRERQRARWSSEEDKILLNIFIASVLFIPRYNLDKVFIYNTFQIRDILHKLLPCSRTKTGSSVRRRIHCILKSKPFFTTYRRMLEFALRDEELYSNYILPHLPPPSVNLFHRTPTPEMEAVVEYLCKKFANKDIPPSSKDLEAFLDEREFKRMEGMWLDVWGCMYHTFYKRTELPILLPSRIEQIGQNTSVLVSQQQLQKSASSTTPAYSDDQLDAVYGMSLNLLSSASSIIQADPVTSSSSDDEDEEGRICLRLKGDGGFPIDILTCEKDVSSPSDAVLWNARNIFMSVLLGGGRERIKEFMSNVDDATLDSVAHTLRFLKVFVMAKPGRKFVLTNTMKRKLSYHLSPKAFHTVHSINCSLGSASARSTSLSRFTNMGAVYVLSEIGAYINITCTVPPSVVNLKDGRWEESTGEGEVEGMALRLLKSRLNVDSEERLDKDFFEINLPTIELQEKEQVNLEQIIHGDLRNEKEFLRYKLREVVEYDPVNCVLGPQERVLKEYEGLYRLIDMTGEVGISIHFLMKFWNNEELKHGLSYLRESRYICLVGIRHKKYVTARHLGKWCAFLDNGEPESAKQRVVLRTWIDATGEVNWKLVDRVFIGMLGLLQKKPQTLVEKICRSMNPILSHVEVLILVEVLVELGIVEAFKIRKPKKFCLYSKWETLEDDFEDDLEYPLKDYGVDVILELEKCFVELKQFHMSKYARVHSLITEYRATELLEEEDDEDEDFNEFDPEDVEIMS